MLIGDNIEILGIIPLGRSFDLLGRNELRPYNHLKGCRLLLEITTMTETTDILIIGGGVMGASIAYHLAKQGGRRILLLERQAIGNGTTGRSGAIVRQHYSNDFTIRMAKDSLAIFQHFDEMVGGDCGFVTTGMVVMTNETGVEPLRANVGLQQKQGVNTHVIAAEELSDVAPGYSGEGVALACYEPDAGVADPMATTYCFAQRVRDREGQRVAERIVDEALGCEMDDEVGVANDAPAEVAVTDVPDDEAHPVPVDEVGDIVHVPRVRQLVEDREPRPGEDLSQVLGYVGADEPAAPSYHDPH